jgi:4-diphosphocytidyl-2-C-methyl-D-erythritol kinase
MISFPNCKINLGLNIIRKRNDGFHDLETIFFPVPFTDILEIISAEEKNDPIAIGFSLTGLHIDGDDNLCTKAYNLLKRDFPHLPALKMHLHKVIPMGAGLGGGSSDGAFTLQLLNEKFKLQLNTQQLLDYALQLGSDCPFFIINKPCFATSRGEILQQININLTNYKIMIINPGIHSDTKWAFSKIIPREPKISILQIILQPIETWKDQLLNDFEAPLIVEYPQIKEIKEAMYQKGALYASLSGSGSSIFGIFAKEKNIDYKPGNNYFHKVIEFN